jgi:hypothetical protein
VALRDPQIPYNLERVALQKLLSGRELTLSELHPTGTTTLDGMVKKGWIVRTGKTFVITPVGVAAFKAKIPAKAKAK